MMNHDSANVCWNRNLGRLLNRLISGLFVLGLFVLRLAAPVAADEVDTERAMRSLQRTTWYDSNEKTYKTPQVGSEQDEPVRSNGWLADRRKPWDWSWLDNLTLGNWTPALGEVLTRVILILLAISLLAVVAALIYYALREYLPSGRSPELRIRSLVIDPARVEDLPFQVDAVRGDPLAEAQRLMLAGRYDQAIVYLYGYMLLALDNAHRIHLLKGKTNRMYLRELQRERQRLRAIVEVTMLAFEQVYFGKHSLEADHFQAVWGQIDEFHRLLTQVTSGESDETQAEVATA